MTHWLGHVGKASKLLAVRIEQARLERPNEFRRYMDQMAASTEPFLYREDASPLQSYEADDELEVLYAAHRYLQSALLFLGGLSRQALHRLLDPDGEFAPADRDARRSFMAAVQGSREECRTREGGRL